MRQSRGNAEVYRAIGRTPSITSRWAAAVAAVGLTVGPAVGDGALPAPEGAKRLDPVKPVWVDPAKGRVAVDGHVCLRKGVLEMFACPAGTKEHEAIVAVDAPAFLLHTALLAVGAEPGAPVKFEPQFRAPTGPRIEVTVEWIDADGARQTVRAQQWIRDIDTGEPMTLPFVFAGSGFWTDPDTGRQRYLADSGDLICVSNFGTAMLDVPAPSTQSNDSLLFEPFTERIPPLMTEVRVWMTVAKTPTSVRRATLDERGVGAAVEMLRGASIDRGANPARQEAWGRVADCSPDELITALRGLEGASPQAQAWLRTAIDAASQRLIAEATLPATELVAFIDDRGEDPRARRTAYEILVDFDTEAAAGALEGFLDDPSPELRYDAVEALLERADQAAGDAKGELLRRAVRSARTLPQIEKAAAGLTKLGDEVDLTETLGFVVDWRVVGPFDNREGVGFNAVYPPEESLDAAATFESMPLDGDKQPIAWKRRRTDDRLGEVDLNAAIGPHKGAVAYAWATVVSDRPCGVQLRYTSRNATKLWLNGEEVAVNHVYHDGADFDQVRVDAELRAGANQILLKACQNEQTQPWAQVWNYKLRVCDALGGRADGVTTAELDEGTE